MEKRSDTSSIDYRIQKGILQPGEYKQAYMNLKPKDSTTAGQIREAAAKIMHNKQEYEAICSILKTGYRSELARLNAQNRDKKAAKPLDLLGFLEPLNDPFNMEKAFTAEEAKYKRMMDMFGLTRLDVHWYQNNERVPWYLIGCIHYRESNEKDKPLGDTYLGNGQSLNRKTTIVPKNEPNLSNGPPFHFEEASVYAVGKHLKHTGHWQLRTILEAALAWNGNGYANHGVNTPYLWGGSQYYDKGAFIEDHQFKKGKVNETIGVACILSELEKSGRISIPHA